MRIFASRRPRNLKAASLKAEAAWTHRLAEQLSTGDFLLRISLCLVFLVLLVVSIGGWQIPFAHRVGRYIPDGIQAHVPFTRNNLRKTENKLADLERQVTKVFDFSPALPRELQQQLKANLYEVARVSRPTELSAELQNALGFQLPPQAANRQLPQDIEAAWAQLKNVIGAMDRHDANIEEIVSEFTQLIAPIRETGIIDESELVQHDLRTDDQITIISDLHAEPVTINVSEVMLSELLKGAGKIGSQWRSYPAAEKIQPFLEKWLRQKAPVCLRYSEEKTARRLEAVKANLPPVTDDYHRGAVLVPPGSYLDLESLEILRSQWEAVEAKVPWEERIFRILTVTLLLLVLGGINGYYLVHNEPRLVQSVSRLTVYLAATTLTIIFGQALSFDPWRAQIIPLLCTVMVLSIAYNQVLAAVTGFSMTLVLTLAIGGGVDDFIVMMSAMATAVVLTNQVSSRSKLIKVGFWTAVAYLIVTWGIEIVNTQRLDRLWSDHYLLLISCRGAGWCLLTGFLVSGSLPFIESLFGIVTDISVLELSDVSHPLLQELVRRAPGTYNHSIGVATIAETAADAIGANGLLCRVGAYFHDIGKMLKPQYFVENMTAGQTSKHEQLVPAMSTLIIIGHVKDGAELAEQHNLPQPLIDFIEQHHGTTLVEFFYHAATRQAEHNPDRCDVEESSFRYPGPKPQSREAAVMMIADAVEGASRTLSDPTPRRLETLVHDIAMKRLLDGQFDECSLTLAELAIVEDSLTKSLIGIHHGRIRYPEQKTA